MSYCRFCDCSDVYVYHDVCGKLCCCGCILDHSVFFDTRSEMIAHLQTHIEAGHEVPGSVIDALQDEIAEVGDALTEEVGRYA